MVVRNRGHWHFGKVTADQGLIALPPTVDHFCDVTLGDDGNDGLSESKAVKTIGKLMTLAAALGTRGRFRGFVAPGGYTENVVTPLNTECPFGQLIAWNPTPGKSYGAAYITGLAGVALTIKARGWLISGFEIAAVANEVAVHLDGLSADSHPGGTIIEDCLITGWGEAGTIGIDVTGNGAPHTTIRRCFFDGCLSDAIRCSNSGTDQPRFWDIDDCTFADNANHINMRPRGFKESKIRNCTFIQIGANRTATKQLDNNGGNACIIGPNNFLSGDYDEGAGGYYAGGNETWRGNHSQDSENGSAQANPAA